MRPSREREDLRVRWFTVPPRSAMLVPRPAGWLLTRQARHHRRLHAARTVLRVSVALALLSLLFVHTQPAMALHAPPVPANEQICGSSILNGGPSSPPGGATTVPAGDNSGMFQFQQANNTTFWFAPGTHTLGSSQFSQIQSGNGDTFIGAPGAVIDGQGVNHFAITAASAVSGVTVEYLTIQNFTPSGTQGVLNVNGTQNWTIEYDTIQDNVPGTGVGLGTNNVLSYNCITGNGEYAFNAYSLVDVSSVTGGPSNITMTFNEMSNNDVCNYEAVPNFPITPPSGCGSPGFNGCGCSGGGKFWQVDQATVADNYILDNYNVGLWADTDNAGISFNSNYVAGNFGEGIMYEISYNGAMQNNVFLDNTWGLGESGTVTGFPEASLYLSESGSDSRVPGANGTAFNITGNQFFDNWGGVVLWENADRYCTSVGNTSTGNCTLVGQANFTTCSINGAPAPPSRPVMAPVPPGRRTLGRGGTVQGQNFARLIGLKPWIDDCRWKTQNVIVAGNTFVFAPADIGSQCTTANYCGFNGVFSDAGSIYPFGGAGGNSTLVENNITFNQNNVFLNNTYCGPWQFDALAQGNVYQWATWQGAPYSQDPGSTMNGAACLGSLPPVNWPGPVNRTVTVPIRAGGGSR